MTSAISIWKNGVQREWFTVRELAELKLPDLPETDRAIQLLAKRLD